MSVIRLTLLNNLEPSGEGKAVTLGESDKSLQALAKLAEQKLGIKAKKFFLPDSAEIDDANILRDGDTVFVSSGEPFHKSDAKCRTLSLAVMGPGAVGKSAMTLQFVQSLFVADYDPTIEDAYRKTVALENGETFILDILDTAGQEDYVALRSTWMRQRDGFVLVFSVSDRSTFEALEPFYEQLTVMHEDGIPPLILAANKCDLPNRAVSEEEGKKLAASWGARYYETSAKTGRNIDVVFTTMARMVRDSSNKKPEPAAGKKWRCAIL